MDTTVRTLRLQTSERGRPNAPHCPSSAGSSQRDTDTPIPRELGLPSLGGRGRGGLDRSKRKKEVQNAVAKRQTKENPTEIEQRKARGPEGEPQVTQTALLASPLYTGQAQGEEEKNI